MWFFFRVRLVNWKWFLKKYFMENDLWEKILQKNKREKREIKICKIFFLFQNILRKNKREKKK